MHARHALLLVVLLLVAAEDHGTELAEQALLLARRPCSARLVKDGPHEARDRVGVVRHLADPVRLAGRDEDLPASSAEKVHVSLSAWSLVLRGEGERRAHLPSGVTDPSMVVSRSISKLRAGHQGQL
mgnify:CR=1 FL=1